MTFLRTESVKGSLYACSYREDAYLRILHGKQGRQSQTRAGLARSANGGP